MSNPIPRLLLPLALCATLAACSDEPEATPVEPAADTAPAAAEAKRPPPPKLAEVSTPYERALRALTSGGSFSFESEVTLANGSSEYASGVGENQDYSFGVRTLPKPNADLDGNWVVHSARWLKESVAGYDQSALTPTSVALFADTLVALPQAEDVLTADRPAKEIYAGGECQPRTIDLAKRPHLMSRYSLLGVCVDEENARLVKLDMKLQTGEQLHASLSKHGESVQIPRVQMPDWSQEFPRR